MTTDNANPHAPPTALTKSGHVPGMDSGRALVAEAAVVSCPDDTTGEAICAVAVLERSLAEGEAITQDTSTLENPAILDQLSQSN